MQAAPGASLNSGDPQPDPRPLPDSEPRPRRTVGLFLAVAAAVFVLDLVTKTLVVAHLQGRPPVRVVGGLLQLTLLRNPGAAFSTGTSYTVVLSLVAVTAVVVVLVLARRLTSTLWAIGLGCLLGGVLGNLTDRLFRQPGFLRGHVVDWIELPHWPVFNIADMCIDIAAVVIILQTLRGVSHNGSESGKAVRRVRSDGPTEP